MYGDQNWYVDIGKVLNRKGGNINWLLRISMSNAEKRDHEN